MTKGDTLLDSIKKDFVKHILQTMAYNSYTPSEYSEELFGCIDSYKNYLLDTYSNYTGMVALEESLQDKVSLFGYDKPNDYHYMDHSERLMHKLDYVIAQYLSYEVDEAYTEARKEERKKRVENAAHKNYLLCDREIAYQQGMIEPFIDGQEKLDLEDNPIISKGLTSFGYDATLGNVIYKREGGTIDPLNVKESNHLKVSSKNEEPFIIEPGSFVLGHTEEYFRIPDNVLAVCVGKSTYARCGLIVNVTPLEPGWEGQVTLELHNASSSNILVYPNQGICQFMFFRGSRPDITYKDREGKYQGQQGVTLPKV